MNSLVPQLRRVALAGRTDQELLAALVARRDEAAFEVLLGRHGPMVLAVCRRVLRHAHDAEDAFQATFLVLVRKASAVRKGDALASWLYGVAYRTAMKARVMKARRWDKERQAAARRIEPEAPPGPDLDAALSALPEKYRVAVVLCELEGRPRRDVARQLNIPEGTLSSRLAAARKALARRLRRDGWTSAGVGGVSSLLLTSTARAAAAILAGGETIGVISAPVLALTEGVVKTMFLTKLKAVTLTVVALGMLGVGASRLTERASADAPPLPQPERPPARAAQLQAAEAELNAARAVLKQAEANLAAARAQLAQREAVYQEVLAHSGRAGDKGAPGAAGAELLHRFKYKIPVETGFTESREGGRIDILEVWGTRPRIEVGGQYLVRGQYALPSREGGRLYFYLTAEGWHGIEPTLDLQCADVTPGTGVFTLQHAMAGPGYFHVVLEGKSGRYANVYFGTGANVWRKD